MANLTIAVEDRLLERARSRALALGTSVNAVLRQHLEAFAGGGAERQQAVTDLLALARRARASRQGKHWTRDELHERTGACSTAS
jgi:hypothetical protein